MGLRAAGRTVWETTRWFAGWTPFAFLAFMAAAATLYVARYTRDVEYFDIWGLVFMGIAAAAAVAAVRRARGVPTWDSLPRKRTRLVLAHAMAILAGMVAADVGAVWMMLLNRGPQWLPWVPIFLLSTFVSLSIVSFFVLLPIVMLFSAVVYLSRASRGWGFLLISILGVSLGALHVSPQLPRHARVLAEWPNLPEILGALVGLVAAFTFWRMDGVAIAAMRESKGPDGAVALRSRRMSRAAWAGFIRAISVIVAFVIGVPGAMPTVFYGMPGIFVVLSESPGIGLILILVFVVAVVAAREAGRAIRWPDRFEYMHGKRVGVCALVIAVNVLWVVARLV